FIHDFKHGISAISNHSIPLLSMKELISRALPTKKRWAVRRAHFLSMRRRPSFRRNSFTINRQKADPGNDN
ncbi:hypothetical protein, partial [Rhizobium aegyptiacum]|uniref:hypothetical protein n=1 Tax=Rhizobium aegyptiacum TaxID=1764550 RepID=UPI001ABFCBF8